MLFLTLITCFLHFIKLVVKAGKCLWVLDFAHIGKRCLFVIIVYWSWYLFQLFWVCKVTSGAIAHANFLKFIRRWLECLKAIINGFIHVRHLFLYRCHTWWQMEPPKLSYRKYLISVIPIWTWWVFCGSRWASPLEIDRSTREPW